MGLFRKKCEYCRSKIRRGKEILGNVKVVGFIGMHPKAFCCEEHLKEYEREIAEYTKKSGKGCGGCC